MKNGWHGEPLGHACPVSNRKPRPFAGGRYYFATGAVGPEGQLSEPERVTFVTRPSRAGCMPEVGDVGFARMKGTKKVVLIDASMKGLLFSTGFCFLAPRPHVDPRFVFFFLTSDAFQHAKDDAAGEGIMGGIKNADAARIEVSLPSLSEQQRIAALLAEAFESIATAEGNVEKNLQNAQALFESNLQAVFSPRGEGWVEKPLVKVSKDFGRGKSKHRPRNDPKLYGGQYPFIQTGDVRNSDHLITSYSQTYNESGRAQSKLWPKGTLCITIAANIAETGILEFDACFPDSVIGVVVDEHVTSNRFLEYLLQSFKAHLQAQGKGSAQDNINLGTFEKQSFPFPDLNEQETIVSRLDALREETRSLEAIYRRKVDALGALRKSLLHQAFIGKL